MITLLIIIVVLCAILEIISLKRDPEKLEFDYAISVPCTEPGVPFNVQAIVTNKSRVPVSYLSVREVFPAAADVPEHLVYRLRDNDVFIKKVCRLKSSQRKKLTMETSIEKRGVHTFRSDSMEFGDFLGFREILRKIPFFHEIVVYPVRIDYPKLTDALGRFCGDIAAKRYLIRDPILTVGSREYTGREPMKEIHWSQSAHRGELMVREFDYNRQLSVSVILSVYGIDPKDENEVDECCVAARAVCETMIKTGITVKFFSNARLQRKSVIGNWKCEVSAGRMETLLESLGRASCVACGSFEKLLEYAMLESEFEDAFIIILPPGNKQGTEAIDRLRRLNGQEVMIVDMSDFSNPDTSLAGDIPDLSSTFVKEAAS